MDATPNISLSTLDELKSNLLESKGIRLFVKRDDKIHSDISGNKWRKLKYNLLQCQHQKNDGILTFGGAFSNHLVATAAACAQAGLKSVGVVRGDELNAQSNETLKRCSALGMQLHFVSRSEYYLKEERAYHEDLMQTFPNYYFVPEGGANYLGMIGCQEMVKELDCDFDAIVLAQGTTTTSCGVLLGLKSNQKMIAVPVLKGFQTLDEMKRLFGRTTLESEHMEELLSKVTVWEDYHFGGYAKFDQELIEFIQKFHSEFGIKLDPIYTGKAMFGLWSEIEKGTLDGKNIVFIHTGGLQGICGVEEKIGKSVF